MKDNIFYFVSGLVCMAAVFVIFSLGFIFDFVSRDAIVLSMIKETRERIEKRIEERSIYIPNHKHHWINREVIN